MQYEQLNDLRAKFEVCLEHQDSLHAKYDLNLTADNLKVAALQAEEEAEAIAEQFLTGSFINTLSHISDVDSLLKSLFWDDR